MQMARAAASSVTPSGGSCHNLTGVWQTSCSLFCSEGAFFIACFMCKDAVIVFKETAPDALFWMQIRVECVPGLPVRGVASSIPVCC